MCGSFFMLFILNRKILMNIIVNPLPNAEDNAMLQALYSRSSTSVTEHLKKVAEVGSGKFMAQYYVGYGHDSIADCGTTTIYIEGVSFLAAKAIQDHPLYDGQECSSRYIDWSNQPFKADFTIGNAGYGKATEELFSEYRKFYTESKPVLLANLIDRFPIKESDDPKVYMKAIEARCFDILRGFLPAGAKTNLSWHTSLRKANDHIQWMLGHPLKEVRDIAHVVRAKLLEVYPTSIKDYDLNIYKKEEIYLDDYYFFNDSMHSIQAASDSFCPMVVVDIAKIQASALAVEVDELEGLVDGKFPKYSGLADIQLPVNGLLDYGSFRDIHRHRTLNLAMPILMPYGVHHWYLEQLPKQIQDNALALLEKVKKLYATSLRNFMEAAKSDEVESVGTEVVTGLQYLLPLATVVQVSGRGNLNDLIYVAELRSGMTVHPTLRILANRMAVDLARVVEMYADLTPDTLNIKRGTQDIKLVAPTTNPEGK